MGFFKRNKGPEIPPVMPTPGQHQAVNDPYAAGGGGGGGGFGGGGRPDPYASSGHRDPYAGVQKARAAGTDPNSIYGIQRGQPPQDPENDANREALFGGFNGGGQRQTQQRKYGYEGREQEEDFDEDDEIEGIRQGMRETKMDSLASTRNALRLAREAEENAHGTIARLADQSESLANSERHLDMAKANSQRAEDKASELKQLNKSIFRPTIVWNKEGKRLAQEQKIIDRHAMEREDRMLAMKDMQDTRSRLHSAARQGAGGRALEPGQQARRAAERKRYQFEATASDDELEDELAENLDETHQIASRLKGLASAMGTEVDKQNQRIGRITDKTDNLEIKVQLNTDRLKAIK
ncbi:hypothetical protein CC85DRAFT_286209 [Cutaneotrichosporon oleaginosum]|uniref:t-SNARE coiled-coil homology domain-containing protein n=1 Tax=Cutaneotrichosporon oleaginosum TaxID=879819 RepID=A0A0J1B230_9TREE|nr:uncharacterized protein CC85DRAFT_286209 [Cutaneotrichosporon oleaginosum]KLT41674.1 hypothetical protein CC85DRAFT_286209 [Cutaneotrichosporon oleaginosum]TXT08046.1 hypothetical protein COLE_04970 [Cutaneotrichosporon oleaginosum]